MERHAAENIYILYWLIMLGAVSFRLEGLIDKSCLGKEDFEMLLQPTLKSDS